MRLRDYQEAAVASIFDYFAKGGQGNPIVALPTGTGKSVVIAAFIRQALETYPGTRVMKLTHVKELIDQNLSKLQAVWPAAPAGVYSAGLGRKDTGYPILFGGVGTVARASPEKFGRVDLLLIDECHLVSSKDSTMYQKVIAGLRTLNPHLKVVGFTATAYRLGHGMLTDADGLFTDTCFDLTRMEAFNWLLAEGYLTRLVPRPTSTILDLSGVHLSGGEYKPNELQEAVDKAEITYAAVREMITYGHDRKHWLIFASGIEHATHVTSMLDSLGVAATCVHSKMPDDQRDASIDGFRSGRFQALVNNSILTTGFDFPAIDLIGMLRPTQSPSLWVQMLGRGTRPVYAPGFDLETAAGRLLAINQSQKQNCLVLDFAGNTRRLGPVNDPVLPRRPGKGLGPPGQAPVKICEACGTYNHASARFCEHCGAEFPKHLKIQCSSSADTLIADSAEPKIATFQVDRVTYTEHRKEGRPPTIQVSYFCGLQLFREWVCLEHAGYPRKKARDWWRLRTEQEPPATVKEALLALGTLRPPTRLKVWLKPKYDEVLACYFEESPDGTGTV